MQLYSLMDRAVTSKSSDVRGFCLLSHATLAMLFTAQLELPISSAAAKFDEELWILDGRRRATSTNMGLFPVQHPVRQEDSNAPTRSDFSLLSRKNICSVARNLGSQAQ